jgi:hypothetical protein
MFTFSNPETEKNFESVFQADKKITIQGVYWGMLSNIPPAVAELMISKKDNQIIRKQKQQPQQQSDEETI